MASSGTSYYLAQQMADAALRGTPFTPPPGTWITLVNHEITPSLSGSMLLEPAWAGYARQRVPSTGWRDMESGVVTNRTSVLFPFNGSNDYYLIYGVAVLDAAEVGTGNLLYYYNFDAPMQAEYGVTPSISSGRLRLRYAADDTLSGIPQGEPSS